METREITVETLGRIVARNLNAKETRALIAKVKQSNNDLETLNGLEAICSKLNWSNKIDTKEAAEKELAQYTDARPKKARQSTSFITSVKGCSRAIEVDKPIFDMLDRLKVGTAQKLALELKANELLKAPTIGESKIPLGSVILRMKVRRSTWTFIATPANRHYIAF